MVPPSHMLRRLFFCFFFIRYEREKGLGAEVEEPELGFNLDLYFMQAGLQM